MKTTQSKFVIQGVKAPQLFSRANPARAGLKLANQNAGAEVRYSIGAPLEWAYCFRLVAGQAEVMDFITPEDDIYIQADTDLAEIVYAEALR